MKTKEKSVNSQNNILKESEDNLKLSKNSRKSNLPKRITVSLPPDSARMLEILSETQSITFNETIRRAISTESFIQSEVRKHSKFLIQTEDGKIKELIFR